jgi:hypothetical protein
VHQCDQAIRRGSLELLELTHGGIAFPACGFDVPARLLVLDGNGLGGSTMSIGDLTSHPRDEILQLLDLPLELLDPQLELPNVFRRHQALRKNVLGLFFMGLTEEAELVFHQTAPGPASLRSFMGRQR